MKKMLKLFAAFAMISLVISFAGCDMATEDELLDDAASTEQTSGNGGSNSNNSGNNSTSGNNNSNTPVSTGGNNSDSSDDSGDEASLWASFEGASMQIWKTEYEPYNFTADLDETDEGLEITVLDEGWWGICFCNDASVGKDSPDVVTFDMSNVAKITFEAKASKKGSIWIAQSPRDSNPYNQQTISLSTSFETKTYKLKNPGNDCYGLFDLGGGEGNIVASDSVITIKNVKFLDANGNECTPERNK